MDNRYMKGIRMNSKATAAALTLAIPLAAMAQTTVEDQQSKIEKALENVLSKQGLSVGGLATGEYLKSDFSGTATDDALRTTEPVTYTQVDFDLRARPNATTTARAVFRMHLDWPNFWGSPSTPIETRWLSLDGKAAGMLYYGVGDMGVRWSPYTMWAPDVGFLYTPRLFEQAQQQAMGERFQGENKRNLQGLQFGLRAAVPDLAIDSFDVGLLGAKLASADHSSAEQLKASYPFTWGAFDRYVLAGHGDITFLKAISLGATYLIDKDLKSTWDAVQNADSATLHVGHDSAQSGSVVAARAGFQADKLLEMAGVKAGLNAEFAHSSWDGYVYKSGMDTVPKLTGNALNASVNAGYVIPSILNVRVTGGYLQNDSAFRNDLAQSPTFHGGRILNTEQLANADGWNSWNTFDAMYHNVYRFIPEARSNNTAKNPVEKNDYTNQVFDPTQYSLKQLDWNLQMVLPGGEATANRVGPKVNLDASILDGAVDVRGAFYSLQEAKATYDGTKAKYQTIQGGAKLRIDKFLNGIWDLPLEIAGSYEQNTGKASDSYLDYTSTVLNIGAYVAVHKRLALLAGYQAIDGKQKTGLDDTLLAKTGYPINNKQTNLGLGAEVKIQEGAYLIAMWNKLTTKYSDLPNADYDQNIVNVKLQMAF
jgi:hypothetical protein